MSVFRLIATTLPMTLLVACGGGGGGGSTAMTGAPTATPPSTVTHEILPDALIADAGAARMHVGGLEAVPDMDSEQIKQTLRSMASASGSELIFSDIIETLSATPTSSTVTCSANNRSCSGALSDGTTIGFSLDNLGGAPEVNSDELMGFNDAYSLVMTDGGVTLAQARAAGRLNGIRFEFQSYGGWLANTVFAVRSETADSSGSSDISYLTAYSFGDASGSNPTASATWHGIMVGSDKQTGATIHADALVTWESSNPTVVDSIGFENIRNIDTGRGIAGVSTIDWFSIPITDGIFENNEVKGSFYGDSHEEVGGVFDRGNLFGAFGADK